MGELIEKTEKDNQKIASRQKNPSHTDEESALMGFDNRPEAIAQRKLQDIANNSKSVSRLKTLSQFANPTTQSKGISEIESIDKSGIKSDQKDNQRKENGEQVHKDSTAPGTQLSENRGIQESSPANELETNDTLDVELFADIEGEAVEMISKQKSTPKGDQKNNDKITQLQKQGLSPAINSLESVTELDKKNVEVVQKADLTASKEITGEDAQIELQGELTRTAKLKGFLGNESTYSLLLKKAEAFNKSKEVSEKQALLKELKPLAQTWLEKHGKEDSPQEDKNEKLKRASIYRFLNQTTSNYSIIIEQYKALSNKIITLKSDPIESRHLFFEAKDELISITNLVTVFKSTYPPSINLLYATESESLLKAEEELTKSGQLTTGSDFDTNQGFAVTNPIVDFDLISGKYLITGNIKLSILNTISAIGSVTVEFSGPDKIKSIDAAGTSLKFNLNGVEIEMENFNYDQSKEEFTSQKASGSFDILGSSVSVQAFGVSITKSGAKFDKLQGIYTGRIDAGLGIAVSKSSIVMNEDYSIEVIGSLELDILGLSETSGTVTLQVDRNKGITFSSIENGQSKFSIGGIDLNLSGINYSNKMLSVGQADGTAHIFSNEILISVEGATFEKKEFKFQKIEVGSIEKLETDLGITVTNPQITINEDYSIKVSGSLELNIPNLFNTKGTVTLQVDSSKKITSSSIKDGSGEISIGGITFKLSGINYGNNKLSVDQASGRADIFSKELSLTVKGVTLENNQFNFEKIEGSLNENLDTGLGISVTNPEITINKDYSIKVIGDLKLNISELTETSGKVTVEVDRNKKITSSSIENGQSKISIGGIILDLSDISYSKNKLTVDQASGKAHIFSKEISLTVIGATIENNKFNFEKIEGKLPNVDQGFFSLSETDISYSKDREAFEGATNYKFNKQESPLGLEDFETSGNVNIKWDKSMGAYYEIKNGELQFKIFGQQAKATNFIYNSTEGVIQAAEVKLEVKANTFDKTFTAKDISINKEGINFEGFKTSASDQEFNMSVFTLKPTEYSLLKDKNGNLRVNAHGILSLTLPSYLGIESNGNIEGDVSIGFNQSPLEFHITNGEAEVKMPNPLNKISEILGENWSSSRYELSAAIPIFPGVSAIFGIYIAYGAKLAEELTAKIIISENRIVIDAGTRFEGMVEGGVFGGVQGGSQLLIALALLLNAGGQFPFKSELNFEKSFPLGTDPAEDKIKNDPGFTYSLSGEAKVQASLEIVATALYFFQKRFRLILGEKSLGSFEYSNRNKNDPNMGSSALADRAMLDEHIKADRKVEASQLKIEQLLDLDYSHRFDSDDKKETLETIKKAEKVRTKVSQKSVESGEFDNSALANLQFYNQFIDNRCNWTGIYNVLDSLGDSLLSTETLKKQTDNGENYLTNTVLTNIKILGDSSNIAKVFVNHYFEKVQLFAKAFDESLISEYLVLLNRKGEVFSAVEDMKKRYLHSSHWGDESKQQNNIITNKIGFGESKYDKFAVAYRNFREIMIRNKEIFSLVDSVGKQTAFKLVQDHERKKENKSE